jgi:hypothetical protein
LVYRRSNHRRSCFRSSVATDSLYPLIAYRLEISGGGPR